jgi:hypothetical protein
MNQSLLKRKTENQQLIEAAGFGTEYIGRGGIWDRPIRGDGRYLKTLLLLAIGDLGSATDASAPAWRISLCIRDREEARQGRGNDTIILSTDLTSLEGALADANRLAREAGEPQ